MTLHKPKEMLFFGIGIVLIVFLSLAPSVHAGAECASLGGACDDSGLDPMAKQYEIGNSTSPQEHTSEPELNFELADVSAEPNPVMSGTTTTITASFRKKQLNSIGNSSDQNIRLTVKGVGCSTCGFEGFALGAANITGNKFGIVRLGSSNGNAAQADDSALRCTAIISAPDGSEVARTNLLRTLGERYVGIWNANVATGVYKCSVVASVLDSVETFSDVLEIVVHA